MNDRRSPLRGEIWQVALDPVVGHEQVGNRPAVVVSNNALTAGPSSVVIVVPMTRRDRGNPFHVPVGASERGVKHSAVAVCDTVRSASHERLSFRRGAVDAAALAEIEDRLLVLLDVG